MKKIILPFAFSVSIISPAYSTDANLSVTPIDYNNPADSITDFNLLTGTWNASEQVQFCPYEGSGNSPKDKGAIVSSSELSGYSMKLEGVTYTIFSSKMAGIGWIMGAKDTAAPLWTPLNSTETVVYPYLNSSSQSNNLGANVRFAFVKLPGNLPMGVNTFSKQEIAKFKCYFKNKLVQTASINVNTATINVASLACKVNSAKNVPIPLGVFMSNDLPAISKNFGNFSTSVDLSCDSGVIPWMTISDASNSNNITDIINLSPDSTATGIGVQVFYNNQTVAKSLGLDSTSKGNPNQFQVGSKTTGNGQLVSIPLEFKYIRTQEVVTPGDANAAATVTFSYQ